VRIRPVAVATSGGDEVREEHEERTIGAEHGVDHSEWSVTQQIHPPSGIFPGGQAVFLQLVIERAGLDTEEPCGLGLDALRILECLLNELLLERLQDLGEGMLAAGEG